MQRNDKFKCLYTYKPLLFNFKIVIMKNVFCFLFIISIGFILTSCKKTNPVDASLRIRVLNATPFTIASCSVNPTGESQILNLHEFGKVEIDQISAYKTFNQIYAFPYVKVIMDNKTYESRVIDYVGENPITSGSYTYKIKYSPTYFNGQPGIYTELIKN